MLICDVHFSYCPSLLGTLIYFYELIAADINPDAEIPDSMDIEDSGYGLNICQFLAEL